MKKEHLIPIWGDWVDFPEQWISVKDRLPTHEGEVLTINHWGYYSVGMICFDPNEYDYFIESDSEIITHITHWMPLPEPPKEKK